MTAAPAEAEPEPAASDEGNTDEGTALRKREGVVALREWAASSKATLDAWQKKLDDRIRTAAIATTITPFSGLNKDVRVLQDRIAELEAKLAQLDRD
jgi:predicted  nucleic acid-binding Zn-ribbon protein